MKAIKAKDLVLTCEYLKAPLGIENAAPRFAWKGEGSLATAKQCSYQINVWNAHGSVWDSGEVSSSQSCGIEYAGAPLQSATRYSWNVRITTEHSGECYESDTAYFETGLLSADDWAQAKWIAAPVPKRGVAPLLRRVFQLDTIPQVARLYLSGLGYAEVTINGHKLDGSRLDPGWTDYRKTVLYRAWDVGAFLQTGENVLAVELGEGWYGNDHAGFKTLIGRLPDWLGTPRLISMLALDEKRIISANDGSWLVSEGAVQNNNLYDGEYYDARLEKEGWQLAGYRPSPTEWTPAAEVAAPGGRLRCQLMPPITEVAEVKPFSITYAEDGGPTEVVV
ncbi:MAG: alpha-L-rhamnosidase N-terminal domain-containing protein, partial [Angelakisella sp.]